MGGVELGKAVRKDFSKETTNLMLSANDQKFMFRETT